MSSIVPSPPKKVTVASSPAGWLSIDGQALTFALVSASATVAGVVDFAAQTFAGVKTFTSTLIASAGIQVGALWNTNGTSASDVVVKVGTSQPDASTNGSAKILAVYTGIGGTEILRAYFTKDTMVWPQSSWTVDYGAGTMFWRTGATAILGLLNTGILRSGYGFDLNPAFGASLSWQVQQSGLMNQAGVDDAANIGNRTQNAPCGINTIASGATSVTITNSLVPNPATKKIRLHLTWRGDPGSRWWWTQTTGAITINLSSAAPANTSFDWALAGLLP